MILKVLFLNLIFFIFFSLNLLSQSESKLSTDSSQINTTNYEDIPKLSVVIDLALKNSPLFKASELEIKKILEQIKINKRSWLDYIQIEGNVRYGLFNQLTINDQLSGSQSEVALKSANEQFNYYGGLTFKLPLSEFNNARNRVRIQKLSIQESEFNKEVLRNEITQSVIEVYYTLQSIHESLNSAQELLQTMNIAYLKSVKEIENGTMQVSEFAIFISNKDKAQQGYTTLKNNYYTQFFKLKILMGETLNIN